MDLYQRLGIKRGASEAEIKKAYRSLAKQLHPDRNKDNPKAAERFGEITQAYDLLSDKDKRARYDRGEIDEDGNPKMPFGARLRRRRRRRRGRRPAAAAVRRLSRRVRRRRRGRPQRPVRRPVRRRRPARRRRQGGFGGFGQRGRAPQKGADVAYRLKVPFVDAATLAPQRITLADGKTIDLKLPKGLEDGTRIRLAGKGEQGPGGRGDAIVTIAIAPHPFFTPRRQRHPPDLPVTLKEAVLGAKVKVPTPDGPVMLTIPKGTTSGKVLRLKGRGFTDKDGKRGDQLVTVAGRPAGRRRRARGFAERWNGGGNPRAGAWRLAAPA